MVKHEEKIHRIQAPLERMYKEYFLDYASYVILERAVPGLADGLKPVQRRILYSLKRMHDGRYHKVANIIGHSMQFHPHGDASIGDALVNIGQKELLIDTQGNWGDYRTGDSAAAPRYIEARLTALALDVLFNADTTEWQLSYDGRNQEPIALPAKIPLLLIQGVEGIAVGLSTKILPHNFCEIMKASIQYLKGRKTKLYPDFLTGGLVDVSEYNDAKRGAKVKIRARIEKAGKNELIITEIPYNTTTSQLIDSILKANEKGKIKIKGILDNTAENVEIRIQLAASQNADLTIDALYAFTLCEQSVTVSSCVIDEQRPEFLSISAILAASVERTRDLLSRELKIEIEELQNKWHFASLEKIFIGERIYRDIENCRSWNEVLVAVRKGLYKYVKCPDNKKPPKKKLELLRDISDEDITRLTEIRIKRISKYNIDKATQDILAIEDKLDVAEKNLKGIVAYTIAFYQMLLDKYGHLYTRRTEIKEFSEIKARQVVANNVKLYYNARDGFIGTSLRKDEFISDCSELDDVISINSRGTLMVHRVTDKVFVGKDIIHVDIWKKGDERTTYNMIYTDLNSGISYAKRFNVKAITREKEYNLCGNAIKAKVKYLSVNRNGEAELLSVFLSGRSKARIKEFEFDFMNLGIKGRTAKGNIITRYPISRTKVIEAGISTLGEVDYWINKKTGWIENSESDIHLGSYAQDDMCVLVYDDGTYELILPGTDKKIDVEKLSLYVKYKEGIVLSAIYYEGKRKSTMIKRFIIETLSLGQKFGFIGDHKDSKLLFVSGEDEVTVEFNYKKGRKILTDYVRIHDFIDVKGWKAIGNKLEPGMVKVLGVYGEEHEEGALQEDADADSVKPGDVLEFDVKEGKQGELF